MQGRERRGRCKTLVALTQKSSRAGSARLHRVCSAERHVPHGFEWRRLRSTESTALLRIRFSILSRSVARLYAVESFIARLDKIWNEKGTLSTATLQR